MLSLTLIRLLHKKEGSDKRHYPLQRFLPVCRPGTSALYRTFYTVIEQPPEYKLYGVLIQGRARPAALSGRLSLEKEMNTTPLSPRRMSLAALTMMTVSNMMGSGVFMLPATLARIGSISTLGWGLTFSVVICLALIFVKMNSLFPCNGGFIMNIRTCFGPFAGLQMMLGYWVSTWVGNCALLLASIGYLSYFFPSLVNPVYSVMACLFLLWFSVLVGLFGAKVVGRLQLFTGGCMLAVVLGVGIFGWMHFDHHLYQAVWNVSHQSNQKSVMNSAVLSMWGFLGIESASVSFGQVDNPGRAVPLATILGLCITGVCYFSSINVIMGILPNGLLIASASPFADSASAMWGHGIGELFSAAAVIACLGAIPGWQILQTEVPRSGAENGLLPPIFSQINRYGVPWVTLILTALLMSVLLLMTLSSDLQTQFSRVITLAVIASLFPYFFAVITLPGLMVKKKFPVNVRFYAYSLLSLITLIFIAAVLFSELSQALLCCIILQIVTIPIYLLYVLRKKNGGKRMHHFPQHFSD